MTSILEVEQLDTLSSNASSTITIGGTNATTLDLGSNVTGGSLTMTPAFEAYQNPAQTPGNNVWTKLTVTNETFDTDSAYDTTNSKFTVPTGKGGTYFFVLEAGGYDSSTTLNIVRLGIYKNGSLIKLNTSLDTDATSIQTYFVPMTAILQLSAGDYIEPYINAAYGGTFTTLANASGTQLRFMGFRIIGL